MNPSKIGIMIMGEIKINNDTIFRLLLEGGPRGPQNVLLVKLKKTQAKLTELLFRKSNLTEIPLIISVLILHP